MAHRLIGGTAEAKRAVSYQLTAVSRSGDRTERSRPAPAPAAPGGTPSGARTRMPGIPSRAAAKAQLRWPTAAPGRTPSGVGNMDAEQLTEKEAVGCGQEASGQNRHLRRRRKSQASGSRVQQIVPNPQPLTPAPRPLPRYHDHHVRRTQGPRAFAPPAEPARPGHVDRRAGGGDGTRRDAYPQASGGTDPVVGVAGPKGTCQPHPRFGHSWGGRACGG